MDRIVVGVDGSQASAQALRWAVAFEEDARRVLERLGAGGGFAGLLLGSVSHQVAAHAPCPVVVVPSS